MAQVAQQVQVAPVLPSLHNPLSELFKDEKLKYLSWNSCVVVYFTLKMWLFNHKLVYYFPHFILCKFALKITLSALILLATLFSIDNESTKQENQDWLTEELWH